MSNENDRFRMMVEQSQDWFWEFDENANFTYVSPRIRDLLGYEPEQLIGLNAFDLMAADEAERVHRHFDPIARKYLPFNNLININRHKDGYEVVIESSGAPIFDEEGQFRGYRGIDRDVTGRKLMEENYRLFTGLTSDYVHYCTRFGKSQFQVKWIGGAINPISGYSVEDVLTLGCFLPMVHPEDQQRVSDYLLELVPGDRKTIDFRIVTQQQEIRWVSEKSQCNAGPSEGELILLGAVTDITKRKKAEERLRESEERFRNIAEMLPEVVFELDLSGSIRFANRKAFETFGYSEEAFVRGLNALDMVAPEERDLARERIQERLAGEEVGAKEYTALRNDGSTFPVILNSIPIIKDKEPVGILGIMTDITERKSNEMALLAATRAAEAANNIKSLFLANVSHEIRTPMTAIIGFSELLEDANLTPEERRYVEAIQSSASILSSLLEDILDLSKVEAGELVIKQKEFNLHKLITELVSTQKKQMATKDLSLNLSVDSKVPESLIGDPLRIRQVLLNLLDNAIKFTEKGEIGVDASVAEETGHWVMLNIAVKDSGIGISKNLQKRIFEPFFQAHGDRTHNYGGTGLGLAISRRLADLMGGSLRVNSQKGVGSTFQLIIPLQRLNDNKSEKFTSEREPLAWNGPPLNILLAEDNPINSVFIATVLNNMGHTVTVAENGRIALDTLTERNFDVALMDIQMPLISGVDVLSVIRKGEELSGKHLNVIALTAHSLIGDQEKYLEMGFDGYLSKPFKQKDLMDEMARVILD